MHVTAVAVATTLVSTGVARAQDEERVSWWLEARPWSCSRWVAPLARMLELACDAGGGTCGIAASAGHAGRRAVLRCDDLPGRWTVEAYSNASGERLWALDLDGDEHERLRRAAAWIAGHEAPDTIEVAPLPRDATGQSPADTRVPPAGPCSRSSHGAFDDSPDIPDGETVALVGPPPAVSPPPPPPVSHSDNGLIVTLRWSSPPEMTTESMGFFPDFWGARVGAAFAGVGSLRIGAAADFGEPPDGLLKWMSRTGATVTYGAPYGDGSVLGVGLEGGTAFGVRDVLPDRPGHAAPGQGCTSGFATAKGEADCGVPAPADEVGVHAFATWYTTVSWSLALFPHHDVRPIAAFSATTLGVVQDVPSFMYSLDLGFAWSAW